MKGRARPGLVVFVVTDQHLDRAAVDAALFIALFDRQDRAVQSGAPKVRARAGLPAVEADSELLLPTP